MGISQPGNSPESVLLENLKKSHPIRKGDINGDGKIDSIFASRIPPPIPLALKRNN